MLRGRGWGAKVRTLKQLYIQYIRPVLEHGSVVTAEASASHIKILEVAERKALRVLLGAPIGYRTKDLYAETGIQPIGERLCLLRQTAINRFDQREGNRQLEDARAFIGPNLG